MKPKNTNQAVEETNQAHEASRLNQVTPLSKYLAMALFIILPFLGGYIGYMYAPEKAVEVEKVVSNAEPDVYIDDNDSVVAPRSVDAEARYLVDSYNFSWNGMVGTITHECDEEVSYREQVANSASYKTVNEKKFCNSVNSLRIAFNGQEKVLEEFSISTTSDYRWIEQIMFTQDDFLDNYVEVLYSQNENDRLLISFYHEPCHWEEEVCYRFRLLTHSVSLPTLEVEEYGDTYSFLSGLHTLKWNQKRTAFVRRTPQHGGDLQPVFHGYVLGSSEPSFTYDGDINLSRPADQDWTAVEKQFAERMYLNDEVEWLDEYQVRIFDKVFTLD